MLRTESIWEISVPSSEFCCEAKASLKIPKVLEEKKLGLFVKTGISRVRKKNPSLGRGFLVAQQ